MPPPYRFSQHSEEQLATCHEDLQKVLRKVIERVDFTVLEGYRSPARQDKLFADGVTKARAGKSLHNRSPSRAVDLAPYPINWHRTDRFTYLAGYVVATAASMGIALRWGGDWDVDGELTDNVFDDLVHFELL